jgi:hypothetical protein
VLLLCLIWPGDPLAEAASAGTGKDGSAVYLETKWDQLIPPSWNPAEAFEGLNLDEMEDDDPRAEAAMQSFIKKWNEAPVNPEMQGRLIRLAGFVAPLDYESSAELKEFLLVPYFGACIHVPPPPANQIVYVRVDRPLLGIEAMEPVWVYGELRIEASDTDMGHAGYSLRADRVELYEEP